MNLVVKPITEDKLHELERELEFQKKRFQQSSQLSIEKIQEITSLSEWIQRYPLQGAGICFMGGLVFAQLMVSGIKSKDPLTLESSGKACPSNPV